MVLRLPMRSPVEYETHLRQLLRTEIDAQVPILFLDCGNSLTKYLRMQTEWKDVWNKLGVLEIQEMDGLRLFLKAALHPKFADRLKWMVVSPYYHLLEDLPVWKQQQVLLEIDTGFRKLEEKWGLHVVVAED